MKKLVFSAICLLLLASVACGGPRYIEDLPLVYRGVHKNPAATTTVDQAFAAVPIELGELRDVRTGDKSKVGTYEDDGFTVRTNGDVRAFWAGRFRALLESAGARFQYPSGARIDADLIDFDCVEGNTFDATVRMRLTVTRHDVQQPWSKVYEGKGKRWGRTHNPENFDEALSNALAEATRKVVQDPGFANALQGRATEAQAQ
jgi:hypothetical protein